MGMTKANVEDRTIRPASDQRNVGDVTKIGAMDTAKAGSKGLGSGLDVDAPFIGANPGFSDGKGSNDYIPSVEGDANRAAEPFSAPNSPDMSAGEAMEEASVNDGPYGQRVNWPAAADMSTSGGTPKSTTTLVEKTGSVVKFPAAADTVSAGKGKDVMSFVPSGADWK